MSDEGGSLCERCGLCCDGTLFQAVPIDETEAARLGSRIERCAEGMRQPCRALQGCSCLVYVERPQTCRTYRCRALQEVEAGGTTVDEALEFVANVVERRRALAELMGLEDDREALQLARRRAKVGSLTEEQQTALDRLARLLLILNFSRDHDSR